MIQRAFAVLFVLGALLFYVAGQRKNPPAFFVDESAIAYNAYTLATHGTDEYGNRLPLYFAAYGEHGGHPTGYLNPTYIYVLAGVFKVAEPSSLVARRVSALSGFAAALLLAALAWRVSRSRMIAAVTLAMAIFTPMLFEISRLAFEVALYPLATATLLWAVYAASQRVRWGWREVAAISAGLILTAYTYSIGRLFAALLLAALAACFLTRARLAALAGIAAAFALTVIVPITVFNARHQNGLVERFRQLTYAESLRSNPLEFAATFERHVLANLSPIALTALGDPNPRHHVPGSGGSLLLATYILGVIGAVLAVRRRDRWWLFVAAGTLLSLIPASLTNDDLHTLRLIPLPLFLIVLSIPALQSLRPAVRLPILALGLAQAVWFFTVFHLHGAQRGPYFDDGIGAVIRDAAATGQRPIHVDIAAPSHALWFGALNHVDGTALPLGRPTAAGKLVVTDKAVPAGAMVVSRHAVFTAYVTP